MIVVLPETTMESKEFRAHPWPFQQTFLTPLKDLPRFVSTCLARFDLTHGVLETDEVVFEPRHVLELANARSLVLENEWRFILKADGMQDIAEMLVAVLGDWIDFLLVPVPQSFAIYTEHDEFTTFYAPDEPTLLLLTADMQKEGFEVVSDYHRPSGEYWK